MLSTSFNIPALANSSAPIRILAIIVVYKRLPEASSSLQTLLKAIENVTSTEVELEIIIADNTLGGQTVESQSGIFRYWAYPDNPGLAQPYNDALRRAQRLQFNWLLTLDQDTSLPENFLIKMAQGVRQYEGNSTIAAIVPRIMDQGRPISPFCFKGGFLPIVRKDIISSIAHPHTSALNSASLLRVSALTDLNGYDERFPLHNSDTCLYRRLDRAAKRVAVIGDLVVVHELSILDRERRISPERYQQMLEDECAFWDLYMGPAGRAERLVRLFGRFCKGILKKENPTFIWITLGELRRRLSSTRKARIRAANAAWANRHLR